jgi:predicted permease
VNTSLIAEEFNADPECAASAVMATTVLSVIPVMITSHAAGLVWLH